jgi:predicted amidohydrolase YtcJ
MTAHTTGGASTDALLDAYEAADREQSISDRRFTLTHANFPDDRAIARAKKLGVLMDLQPAWYHHDGPALATVLGPDRMKFFHAYKSIFDAGVIVAGGSDHMIKFDDKLAINPFNPFFGMWMVVTRKTADGTVYNPEQKITREQALKMWTWNAAYVSFDEEVKGSIEPGKLADFAIIDRDYLTCPEDEIQDIAVLQTIVGGEVVYDRATPK